MKPNTKLLTIMCTALTAGHILVTASNALADTKRDNASLDAEIIAMANTRVAGGNPAGMVIATIDGAEKNFASFGVVSKAKPQKPSATTVYEIGSITKTFTALLLADAVARGTLKLDNSVDQALPEFKIPSYNNHKITWLDLATQTSGLPRLPSNMMPKNVNNPYADYHESDLKTYLDSAQLSKAPGTHYEYSNLGFGLLGVALAHHGKASFTDLIQERITRPLNMQNTGIKLTASMQTQLAPGHSANGVTENWDFDAMAGAGAIRSNAEDMLKYLQAQMSAIRTSANKPDQAPLGIAMTHLARRPAGLPETQMGLAWHIKSEAKHNIIWHNGATGGYTSFIGFTADGQHGVVILANGNAQVDDIAMRILRPHAASALPKEINLNSAEQDEYLGQYQLAANFVLAVKRNTDGLYMQATGQGPAQIYASQPDQFFLKLADIRISFERDANGKITGLILHQAGRDMPARKLSKDEIPAEKIELKLPAEKLAKYVGKYQLAPQFVLNITQENNQLFLQATGQGRNPIYASTETEFFLKVVDAQIQFQINADGKVSGLILIQGGQKMPATKSE